MLWFIWFPRVLHCLRRLVVTYADAGQRVLRSDDCGYRLGVGIAVANLNGLALRRFEYDRIAFHSLPPSPSTNSFLRRPSCRSALTRLHSLGNSHRSAARPLSVSDS